jgi:hypothetical protein
MDELEISFSRQCSITPSSSRICICTPSIRFPLVVSILPLFTFSSIISHLPSLSFSHMQLEPLGHTIPRSCKIRWPFSTQTQTQCLRKRCLWGKLPSVVALSLSLSRSIPYSSQLNRLVNDLVSQYRENWPATDHNIPPDSLSPRSFHFIHLMMM